MFQYFDFYLNFSNSLSYDVLKFFKIKGLSSACLGFFQ